MHAGALLCITFTLLDLALINTHLRPIANRIVGIFWIVIAIHPEFAFGSLRLDSSLALFTYVSIYTV